MPNCERSANARTVIRSCAIRGPGNAPARWDGTARPAPGRVPSTCTARIVKITATARTTRSVRPSTALASARPDTAARIAASCVPRTPSGRIARRRAPARMELLALPRTGAATVRPVSVILCRVIQVLCNYRRLSDLEDSLEQRLGRFIRKKVLAKLSEFFLI